jgi:hypothetical protein
MSMMPPPTLVVSVTVSRWRPITDDRGWVVINNRWWVMINDRSTGPSVIIVIQKSISDYGSTQSYGHAFPPITLFGTCPS